MRIEDMKNWTVDQLKKEVVRLSEECEKRQHEILDLQEYQIELERDCDVMMMYEDQHQPDCIIINQLQTALDAIVDRYANLRKIHGVS